VTATGTYAPKPGAAPLPRMIAAQAALETKMLLRNGEQLLLTMFIPITLLVGLILLPLGSFGDPRQDIIVPAILALAVMSTGFTGQAIAVGFDRRYGALKRLGATALPKWGIIGGKIAAVVLVVALQTALIGGIGLALGWRPPLAGTLLALPVLVLGTATFSALGLLLGGRLRAEIVLALANIIWFVLLGLGSFALAVRLADDEVPGWLYQLAHLSPSGALVSGLHGALGGTVEVFALAVLAVWGIGGAALAVRTFRFT
jgi:ABC-2 type transport system permease protein